MNRNCIIYLVIVSADEATVCSLTHIFNDMRYSGQKAAGQEESSKEEKETPMDPALQADMDEFLEECFNEGSLVSC